MTDVAKDLNCQLVEEGDLVSRYVADQLPEGDAEAFERHYLGCDRCSGELQAALEIRAALSGSASAEKPTGKVVRGPWANWRPLAAAAVVAIGLGGGLWLLTTAKPQRSFTVPDQELAAAVGQQLPIQARLTGAFASLGPASATRGKVDRASPALRDAARRIIERAAQNQAAENLRLSGVAHLILGENQDALADLNAASQADPRSAQILSDLSAALHAAGDDAASFEAASRALEIANLPEARFNAALALDSLHRSAQARAAWIEYLKVDSKSEWADDARRHLRALEVIPRSELWKTERPRLEIAERAGDIAEIVRIVGSFPQNSRVLATDELLTRWAGFSTDQTDRESASLLHLSREIGEALWQSSHDATVRDATRAIERARPEALRAQRNAYRLYSRARRLYEQRQVARAEKLFLECGRVVNGGPLRLLAGYYAAACRFLENDSRRTLSRLEDVGSSSLQGGYISILGLSKWLHGLAEISLGHPYESLRDYDVALKAFEQLHETVNVASVHSLLAEDNQYLGQLEVAARHRQTALDLLDGEGPSLRLCASLSEAGGASLAAGRPHSALRIFDQMVSTANSLNDPLWLTVSYLNRASAHSSLNHSSAAKRDIESARRHCVGIPDAAVRRRQETEIEAIAGDLTLEGHRPESLTALSEAIEFFQRKQDTGRLPKLLLRRGRVYVAGQRVGLARRDFESGIERLESLRQDLATAELRISYFETWQGLFRELVLLLASQGEAGHSLEVAEQARARGLLDAATRAWPRRVPAQAVTDAFSARSLRQFLPEGARLIEFASFDDRLLAWVVRPESIELHEMPVQRSELETMTRQLLERIAHRNDAEVDISLAQLYSTLLRPIEDKIKGADSLLIVPHAILGVVPFAALRNPATKRYLIEDYPVSICPSAAYAVAAAKHYRDAQKSSSLAVLAVGDPAFDRRLLPELDFLPDARLEAVEVASIYPKATLLVGQNATKSALLKQLTQSDVIHFAGHALASRLDPQLSALVLAPEHSSQESGLLYASDLPVKQGRGGRVVVLAACDTASGPIHDGEGVQSMARAFLATGVQVVVATLWPLRDRQSRLLFRAFHKHLSRSGDAAGALRAAQRQMLGSAEPDVRHPRAWASVQAIGVVFPYNERRAR